MSIISIPIVACAFALIVSPLLIFLSYSPGSAPGLMETRYENRIFWPALALVSIVSVALNPAVRAGIRVPSHIIYLALYLALAGASTVWAFSPEASLTRFVQQMMVVTSIMVPALLAARAPDLMRGLFACFAFAVALSIFFVLAGYETVVDGVALGLQGYFIGKNTLGQCAAAALLLAVHEALYPGRRRIIGIIFAILSVSLVLFSNSKTSLALALLVPALAALLLILQRATGISPAVFPIALVAGYFVLSAVSGYQINRLSYYLYGDSTFSGRETIWDYVFSEIQRRPFFGWGYQSFWLVGPDGPSIVNAPGWVKFMPNAHNGYYDTILETGYVGLIVLLAFIVSTLHSIGRVSKLNPRRGWVLLSLAFFVIIYNCLESLWVRGFEFLWVIFLIVAADAARYQQIARRDGRAPQARRYSPALRRQGS